MKVKQIISQLNWRFMLVRLLVNAFVLAITITLLPRMRFVDGSLLNLLFMALVLGFLNALVKPFVQALTMSFFFATYGLVMVLVNALILAILQWLFPDKLVFDSLLWLLIAGLVVGLLSSFFETLLGLTLPITESQSPAVLAQREKQAHVVGWTEPREETPQIETAVPELELPESVEEQAEEPLPAIVETPPDAPAAVPDAEVVSPGPPQEEGGLDPKAAGDVVPEEETGANSQSVEPLAAAGEEEQS